MDSFDLLKVFSRVFTCKFCGAIVILPNDTKIFSKCPNCQKDVWFREATRKEIKDAILSNLEE